MVTEKGGYTRAIMACLAYWVHPEVSPFPQEGKPDPRSLPPPIGVFNGLAAAHSANLTA
jgi:hypothetical protein